MSQGTDFTRRDSKYNIKLLYDLCKLKARLPFADRQKESETARVYWEPLTSIGRNNRMFNR